jgi:hypothetical protein
MLAEFNKDVSNRLHNSSENIISWQMLLKEETTPWETYNTFKAVRLPIASGISPLNSLYERSLSQPKPFNQILPVMLKYFGTTFHIQETLSPCQEHCKSKDSMQVRKDRCGCQSDRRHIHCSQIYGI